MLVSPLAGVWLIASATLLSEGASYNRAVHSIGKQVLFADDYVEFMDMKCESTVYTIKGSRVAVTCIDSDVQLPTLKWTKKGLVATKDDISYKLTKQDLTRK